MGPVLRTRPAPTVEKSQPPKSKSTLPFTLDISNGTPIEIALEEYNKDPANCDICVNSFDPNYQRNADGKAILTRANVELNDKSPYIINATFGTRIFNRVEDKKRKPYHAKFARLPCSWTAVGNLSSDVKQQIADPTYFEKEKIVSRIRTHNKDYHREQMDVADSRVRKKQMRWKVDYCLDRGIDEFNVEYVLVAWKSMWLDVNDITPNPLLLNPEQDNADNMDIDTSDEELDGKKRAKNEVQDADTSAAVHQPVDDENDLENESEEKDEMDLDEDNIVQSNNAASVGHSLVPSSSVRFVGNKSDKIAVISGEPNRLAHNAQPKIASSVDQIASQSGNDQGSSSDSAILSRNVIQAGQYAAKQKLQLNYLPKTTVDYYPPNKIIIRKSVLPRFPSQPTVRRQMPSVNVPIEKKAGNQMNFGNKVNFFSPLHRKLAC